MPRGVPSCRHVGYGQMAVPVPMVRVSPVLFHLQSNKHTDTLSVCVNVWMNNWPPSKPAHIYHDHPLIYKKKTFKKSLRLLQLQPSTIQTLSLAPFGSSLRWLLILTQPSLTQPQQASLFIPMLYYNKYTLTFKPPFLSPTTSLLVHVLLTLFLFFFAPSLGVEYLLNYLLFMLLFFISYIIENFKLFLIEFVLTIGVGLVHVLDQIISTCSNFEYY